jgi:hypothetical protein
MRRASRDVAISRSARADRAPPASGRFLAARRLARRTARDAFQRTGDRVRPASTRGERARGQLVFERPGGPSAAGRRDDGPRPAPAERRGPAGGADGEPNAFVFPVRPQVHHSAGARIEVDLERISGGVAKEPGLVPPVRGRVVEAGLGKREDRCCLCRRDRGCHRDLGQERDQGEGHAHQYASPGLFAGVGTAIHPVRRNLRRLLLAVRKAGRYYRRTSWWVASYRPAQTA